MKALAAVLMIGGAAFLVLSGCSNDGAARRSAGPKQRAPATTWEARMVERGMRLLGRQRADGVWPFSSLRPRPMPEASRRRIAANLGSDFRELRLRFDQARYVVARGGVGIWVVPGKAVTCIFHAETLGMACDTEVDAARRGLSLTEGVGISLNGTEPREWLALGIAPDWARSARLKLLRGGQRTVRVRDNAFALRANGPLALSKLVHRRNPVNEGDTP